MGQFRETTKKAIYFTCVKVAHQTVLKRVRAGRWTEVFGPDFIGSWRSLYKPPIEKRTADLQWRLIHGAIATNRHVAHLNPAVGRECPFCGIEETVDHLFINCVRLGSLFIILKSLFKGFGKDFSNQCFISGPK